MLVTVKTRHIDLRIRGRVSKALLSALRTNFGSRLHVSSNDDNQLVDIFKTDWFKRTKVSAGFAMKTYRENAGMTQEQLSGKLGLGRKHISDMENDSKPISKKTAQKLSVLFDVPLERFI
jgi:DNA-binding XRE family transcriptional regulator